MQSLSDCCPISNALAFPLHFVDNRSGEKPPPLFVADTFEFVADEKVSKANRLSADGCSHLNQSLIARRAKRRESDRPIPTHPISDIGDESGNIYVEITQTWF
jgi:hypothetical protein